jgi:hypothetical protein
LLDSLQNRTHRDKGAAADQSAHGRVGLGAARKEEISRMKNISIESSGGNKLCRWFKENYVVTEKFLYYYFYYYYIRQLCSIFRSCCSSSVETAVIVYIANTDHYVSGVLFRLKFKCLCVNLQHRYKLL